jgi:hypothetical protein
MIEINRASVSPVHTRPAYTSPAQNPVQSNDGDIFLKKTDTLFHRTLPPSPDGRGLSDPKTEGYYNCIAPHILSLLKPKPKTRNGLAPQHFEDMLVQAKHSLGETPKNTSLQKLLERQIELVTLFHHQRRLVLAA